MTAHDEGARLRAIAQWEIALYWNRIATLLVPVMQRPEVDNTLEDVRQFLRAGSMQAWHVGWKTIVITAIQPFGADAQHPTKRVCQVVFCAGEGMEEWLEPAVAQLKTWAASMGCDALRMSGRRGWCRVLPEFKETCTTLETEICPH